MSSRVRKEGFLFCSKEGRGWGSQSIQFLHSSERKKMLLLKWDPQRFDSIFFLQLSKAEIWFFGVVKWQKWKMSSWEQVWVLTPQISWSTSHEAWAWLTFPWLHMIKIWNIYHPCPWVRTLYITSVISLSSLAYGIRVPFVGWYTNSHY